jgi:uncharacterized protein (DUF4415 family)
MKWFASSRLGKRLGVRGKPMKKLSRRHRKSELERIARIPDEAIDTSDIPELTDDQIRRAVLGRMYRPVKKPITLRLDLDVLAWLKKEGPGYQTKANNLLRAEMLRAFARTRQK